MQPRFLPRRVLLFRPERMPNATRIFTRRTSLISRARPQVPFLSAPLARNQQFRYLTTERKRWLAYEVYLGFKYTAYVWAIGGLLVIGYWTVQQEWLERQYPSPPEWGIITRLRYRLLMWSPDRPDQVETNWVQVGDIAKNVLSRLEDPKVEGAGLQELTEGGVWIFDVGKSGYDITAKSEPWRRGYYQVLMMCAKSAEMMADHVVDKTRRIVFPADQVLGPSNPNPKPIPPGSPPAPLEKDVEPFFEPPETYYMRILTTRGFTSKQKMDAALAYASWLDFKGIPEASGRMYEWALQLATENCLPAELPYDQNSLVLRQGFLRPSANVLTSLTALAVHKARNEDVTSALPILISILRARRSLPEPSARAGSTEVDERGKSPWTLGNIASTIKSLASPPKYPSPPDDGESPPVRDARELCEEAGLDLYIGEIIYANKSASSSSREEGLAWTREAVDMAEEQLHRLGPQSIDTAAKNTCRECLDSGLQNWAEMVAQLVREEKEKQESQAKSSWLGLWGEGQGESQEAGRWVAEENVVKERIRRAQDVLNELEPPKSFLRSLFWA